MAEEDDNAGTAEHVLFDLGVVRLFQLLVEYVLDLLLGEVLVQHVLDYKTCYL